MSNNPASTWRGGAAFMVLMGMLYALVTTDWRAYTTLVVEQALRHAVIQQGYDNLSYTLESVSDQQIRFTDVSLAGASPISAQRVTIDYSFPELMAFVRKQGPVNLIVHLEKAQLNDILRGLTSNRASATGLVSGVVPVRLETDGHFVIGKSKLQAERAGTIILAPDAIPGDNEQVTLVREIMKNLHYSQFSMALETEKDKQLSILLSLSGNNPDVYNGREVRLNVHLSGDLLDLLQQSIMPIADPKQLLKDEHAKP